MTQPTESPMTEDEGCFSLPPVGDRGQRYVVSVYDAERCERMDVAYTDDPKRAAAIANGAVLRPSWCDGWVTDRKPQT